MAQRWHWQRGRQRHLLTGPHLCICQVQPAHVDGQQHLQQYRLEQQQKFLCAACCASAPYAYTCAGCTSAALPKVLVDCHLWP